MYEAGCAYTVGDSECRKRVSCVGSARLWGVCISDAGPEAVWAGGWLRGRCVGSGVCCSDRVALDGHGTFLSLFPPL